MELIQSSILSVVLSLIEEDEVDTGNQFETIQMRRECGRIVSSLTRHFATSVLEYISLEELKAKVSFLF